MKMKRFHMGFGVVSVLGGGPENLRCLPPPWAMVYR